MFLGSPELKRGTIALAFCMFTYYIYGEKFIFKFLFG